MCILFVQCKVVSYYDMSVLSMSVMGVKKKKFWMGVGGWGEPYPVLFWIFELFNFAKTLSSHK